MGRAGGAPESVPTASPIVAAVRSPAAWALLLCVVAAVFYAPYFFLDVGKLIDSWGDVPIEDDAFYFLQIARHLVDGRGLTFDGVHVTDGYQPLWLWVLAALPVLGVGQEGAVYGALAIALACLAASAWQTWAIARSLGMRENVCRLLGLATLLSPVVFQSYTTLCESPVNGLLFLTALRTTLALRRPHSIRPGLALGLVWMLLFLARLDNAFTVAGLAVGAWLAFPRARKAVAAASAVFASLFGAYLLARLAESGHVMPVSGAMKSLRPEHHAGTFAWIGNVVGELLWFAQDDTLVHARMYPRAVLACYASFLACCFWAFRRSGTAFAGEDDGGRVGWIAAGCLAACVGRSAYYAVLQPHYNEASWYFTVDILTFGFVLVLVHRRAVASGWRPAVSGALLAAAWLLLNAGDLRTRSVHCVAEVWAPFGLAVLVILAGQRATAGSRPLRVLIPCLLPIGLAFLSAQFRQKLLLAPPYSSIKSRLMELGRWARAVDLQRHGTVGAYSAGLVGQFAGGWVRNLDGLVQDWDYYDLVRTRGGVPPPRGETFVLDYHEGLRRALEAAGYKVVIESVPRPGCDSVLDGVYLLCRDPRASRSLAEAVLADPGIEQRLKRHLLESLREHRRDAHSAVRGGR